LKQRASQLRWLRSRGEDSELAGSKPAPDEPFSGFEGTRLASGKVHTLEPSHLFDASMPGTSDGRAGTGLASTSGRDDASMAPRVPGEGEVHGRADAGDFGEARPPRLAVRRRVLPASESPIQADDSTHAEPAGQFIDWGSWKRRASQLLWLGSPGKASEPAGSTPAPDEAFVGFDGTRLVPDRVHKLESSHLREASMTSSDIAGVAAEHAGPSGRKEAPEAPPMPHEGGMPGRIDAAIEGESWSPALATVGFKPPDSDSSVEADTAADAKRPSHFIDWNFWKQRASQLPWPGSKGKDSELAGSTPAPEEPFVGFEGTRLVPDRVHKLGAAHRPDGTVRNIGDRGVTSEHLGPSVSEEAQEPPLLPPEGSVAGGDGADAGQPDSAAQGSTDGDDVLETTRPILDRDDVDQPSRPVGERTAWRQWLPRWLRWPGREDEKLSP